MSVIYPESSLRIMATAALRRLAGATLTPIFTATRLKFITVETFSFAPDARIKIHPQPFQMTMTIRGIDGGLFDQEYTNTLDGGLFDQPYQQDANGGGF